MRFDQPRKISSEGKLLPPRNSVKGTFMPASKKYDIFSLFMWTYLFSITAIVGFIVSILWNAGLNDTAINDWALVKTISFQAKSQVQMLFLDSL